MANTQSSHRRARLGVRTERIEHLMSEELSFLFSTEIGDPILTDIQVERVQLTGNAAIATVFVRLPHSHGTRRNPTHCVPTSNLPTEVAHALNRAAPFLRRRLIDVLPLKRSPELRFRPALPATSQPEETF